ncbi:hypothetical protein [Olsenella sp. Marseille-P4559]|uniref:hypothetical protein n=1 Tax=Olsenella sp. Marseille-P4559 TaxID=2364795 RepID=UPI001A915066|nr:hypothetical protein [Olsenella sp. Marseille-P4559]
MFGNPFSANVEREMTKGELIQAVRADLSGELEAIYGYDAHVQATDDPVAKAVLSDIRDEEKAHMGELLTLLNYLDPKEGEHYASGRQEVLELLDEIGVGAGDLPAAANGTTPAQSSDGEDDSSAAPTVGSLL